MNTSEKLLDAAELRMRRGGYGDVSFRDLAMDLGIKSSSVHYHFPTKEDLTSALISRYSDRFFESLQKKLEKAHSPEEKLKAYVSTYKASLKTDGTICLCGLLGSELAALPASVQEGVRTFFKANINWVVKALPDNQSKSEKMRRATRFVAAHNGAMMMAVSLQDHKILSDIGNSMCKSVLTED